MSELERSRGRLRRAATALGCVVGGVLLIALVFQGLTADMQEGEEDPAAAFRPARVERDDLSETIVASGTMEPLVRVPVISEVSGIIAAVHVEEGQRVSRGQPLFELDRERLQARVAGQRAELALSKAHARYDLIGRAEAERDLARRKYQRVAQLHENDVASSLELEQAEHALRVAEISLRDAHAEAAARDASVMSAREALRQAERDLENAIIRAPIDGVVIEREGEIGRAVADVTRSGGTIVAVIADDRRIRLVAEIDENDVARVRVGQDARISIDAFPEEKFVGCVRKISAAGTSTGNIANFEVEIEIEPDERLRVGMSSDARIVVREHTEVLLVPNAALVRGEEETLVRVPEAEGGSRHRLVPIDAGFSDGFRTVVSDGLSEGDVIMVRSEGVRS
jgi:HlyD family secretion protein